MSSPGGWTCPACQRRFRRRGQNHECASAMTLDEYFDIRGWLTEAFNRCPA